MSKRLLVVLTILVFAWAVSAGAASEAPGDEPLIVAGNVHPPKLLKRISPEYPIEARRAQIEGKVVLQAIIDAKGKVESLKVLRSVPQLDAAAMDAARAWTYDPATLDGKPVRVWLTIVVTFKLQGSTKLADAPKP